MDKSNSIPNIVPNWVIGEEILAVDGETHYKRNPHNGELLCELSASKAQDVAAAVAVAETAQPGWAGIPPVKRGQILHDIANLMEARREEIAAIVAIETGKAPKEALGETAGAVALARFYAGEGQRLYGKTCTTGVVDKYAMMYRQPVGVAGLIVAANTPIANVAWKMFPALICGNSVVLKASEDTPATAWIMGRITKEAGVPDGVFNILQGLGEEAGEPLVSDARVGVVSFTGSTTVGRRIASIAGPRLAKLSLELGGKNPIVVCDDADLELAKKWILLSTFSNAGQRCAASGRIIIFDNIYDELVNRLVERTEALTVGPGNEDFFGPVINERQLVNMLGRVNRAETEGACVLTGGKRFETQKHARGYYMAPTLIDSVVPEAEISRTELFGPIGCLYRAKDFKEALDLANHSPYGLTASIHTRNFNRAWEFTQKVRAGVAVVNGGTYGSEPHMPFGGMGDSGNGSREPGTEALDIYSDLKNIFLNVNPGDL